MLAALEQIECKHKRRGEVANDVAISVRNLSKAYMIWESPSARIKAALLSTAAKLVPHWHGSKERYNEAARRCYREFHALHDVSFDVRRGECVGIVGRNGSGKSTLLQIIAGILSATSGDVTVNGKVAALLELGSGFNPEYTGRENVSLSAAILGLTRKELTERFEDIVAFADIGEFIDQPVKIYSSGMMLRLAFAVQTAVDPDILIVDEALAVGDLFFQTKCMRRIRKMQSDGLTILFVSHTPGAVKELCDRGVLLDHGRQLFDGSADDAINKYYTVLFGSEGRATNGEVTNTGAVAADDQSSVGPRSRTGGAERLLSPLETGRSTFEKLATLDRMGTGAVRLFNVQLLNSQGLLAETFEYGDEVLCRMVLDVVERCEGVLVLYQIRTRHGIDAVHGDCRISGHGLQAFHEPGRYVFDWHFEAKLMHGIYHIMCAVSRPPAGEEDWIFHDMVPCANQFTVLPRREGMISGLVVLDNKLDIRRIE